MLTEAEVIRKTQNLLRLHGYTDWTVTFGNAKGLAGVTMYATKTIRYSRYLMAVRTEAGTLDTIKHEVAHVIAGVRARHNQVWRKIYLDLGGNGEREWAEDTLTTDLAYRWVYHCPGCKKELARSFKKRRFVYRNRKTGRMSPKVTTCCRKEPTTTRLQPVGV